MAKIYEQHRAAFRDVCANAVLHNGEVVATIAFKYPRDGGSRLYAYVHWRGSQMVRGLAGGGGYDKLTAACADAVEEMFPGAAGHARLMAMDDTPFARFARALAVDGGQHWHNALRDAGFDVVTVV